MVFTCFRGFRKLHGLPSWPVHVKKIYFRELAILGLFVCKKYIH
jgi:hypothetical protein